MRAWTYMYGLLKNRDQQTFGKDIAKAKDMPVWSKNKTENRLL